MEEEFATMSVWNCHFKKEETVLNACKYCDHDQPVLWELPGVYWVQCGCCQAATSMEDDRDRAVRRWNMRSEG